MRTDGQTDRHEEAIRRSRDCANEYKVSAQKTYECDKHFIDKAPSH